MGTVQHEWHVSACGMACEVLLPHAYLWTRDVISEMRSDTFTAFCSTPRAWLKTCLRFLFARAQLDTFES